MRIVATVKGKVSIVQQIRDVLNEGVESSSKDAYGNITKIGGWTPNNLKTVVLTPDRVILEHHVAPLGNMLKKLDTQKVDMEQEANFPKGLLSIFTDSQTRSFSNLEEIVIVVGNNTALKDVVRYTNADIIKAIQKKYPRLYAITVIQKNIDSVALYKAMQQTQQKQKGAVIKWSDTLGKSQGGKITYLNKDKWWDKYELRFTYYVLDRVPTSNASKTSKAQLYTYFNNIKEGYLSQQKQEETSKEFEKQVVIEAKKLAAVTWIDACLKVYPQILNLNKAANKSKTIPKYWVNRGAFAKLTPNITDEEKEALKNFVAIAMQNIGGIPENVKALHTACTNGLADLLISGVKNVNAQSWLSKGVVGNKGNTEETAEEIFSVKDIISAMFKYFTFEYAVLLAEVYNWISLYDKGDTVNKELIAGFEEWCKQHNIKHLYLTKPIHKYVKALVLKEKTEKVESAIFCKIDEENKGLWYVFIKQEMFTAPENPSALSECLTQHCDILQGVLNNEIKPKASKLDVDYKAEFEKKSQEVANNTVLSSICTKITEMRGEYRTGKCTAWSTLPHLHNPYIQAHMNTEIVKEVQKIPELKEITATTAKDLMEFKQIMGKLKWDSMVYEKGAFTDELLSGLYHVLRFNLDVPTTQDAYYGISYIEHKQDAYRNSEREQNYKTCANLKTTWEDEDYKNGIVCLDILLYVMENYLEAEMGAYLYGLYRFFVSDFDFDYSLKKTTIKGIIKNVQLTEKDMKAVRWYKNRFEEDSAGDERAFNVFKECFEPFVTQKVQEGTSINARLQILATRLEGVMTAFHDLVQIYGCYREK